MISSNPTSSLQIFVLISLPSSCLFVFIYFNSSLNQFRTAHKRVSISPGVWETYRWPHPNYAAIIYIFVLFCSQLFGYVFVSLSNYIVIFIFKKTIYCTFNRVLPSNFILAF